MSRPAPAVMAFCRKERRDKLGETAEAIGVGTDIGFAAFSAEVSEAREVEFALRGGMVGEAGSAASKSGGGNNVYWFGVFILIHVGLSFSSAFVRKERLWCNKRSAAQAVELEAQATARVDKSEGGQVY